MFNFTIVNITGTWFTKPEFKLVLAFYSSLALE